MVKSDFPFFPSALFQPGLPFLQRSIPPSAALRDPWARRDAWLRQPYFSAANRRANLVPGILLGSAAFAAYVLVDSWRESTSPEMAELEAFMEGRRARMGASHHGGHH